MQSTETQSADYASLSIPGKNTLAPDVKAQAITLLASVEANIRRDPELREEFDREHFVLRLSSVFNQNAVINSIRAVAHPKKLLREIEKSFYNFKTATLLLETNVDPEIEDAVITLIAETTLEKHGLSQAPAEIKKPAPQVIPDPRHEEPAPPKVEKKNNEQEIVDKKRRKVDPKIKKEQDRKTLEVMRPLMEETQALLLRESMSSPAQHDPAKTAEVAQQVLTYINRALELKLVNVMGAQKYLATTFQETFNRHAGLTDLQAQAPHMAEKVREKFRHVLIAATRLKVKLNPHIKFALIDALIQEAKDDAAEKRERVRQTAIKNGQTEKCRETARKLMTERRNDPEKNAARTQKLQKTFQRRARRSALLKKLNSDPNFIARQRAHLKRLNSDEEVIARRRAQFKTPEFIAKRNEGLKKFQKTEKFRAQHRKQLKQLNKDPEILARRRAQMEKINKDPEVLARRRAQLEKLNKDPDRIAARREQIIKMNKDPANIARKIKKAKNNPELIAQLTGYLKKIHTDPVLRQKHLTNLRAYWAEQRAKKNEAAEDTISEITDHEIVLLEDAVALEAAPEETLEPEFALVPE